MVGMMKRMNEFDILSLKNDKWSKQIAEDSYVALVTFLTKNDNAKLGSIDEQLKGVMETISGVYVCRSST